MAEILKENIMNMLKSQISKNSGINKSLFSHIFITLSIYTLISCAPPDKKAGEMTEIHLADTLEESLFANQVDPWYPRVIDTLHGGYFSTFAYDWEKLDNQSKSIVYIARHIWTTSFLYQHYPQYPEFLDYAEHGFQFLKNAIWDKEEGGYYITVSREGTPVDSIIDQKRIYGQAFAIYALAQYYLASDSEEALEWAKKSFNWIEKNPHDKEYGGYFEFLHRDGTPITVDEPMEINMNDWRVKGFKDYNSSIHVLEALTTLYQAWPDELVRERLDEMFHIVRDTMVTEPGYLLLYFHPDWTVVSGDVLDSEAGDNSWYMDHVTFGHDIETAFLLLEAAEALGVHDEKTSKTIKMLVDHTLEKGWDKENGGIYDAGKYYAPDSMVIINKSKSWWGEAEALNSLLLMHEMYPNDPKGYYSYFVDQWDYINTYLIDHEYGGWFSHGIDQDPESRTSRKAHNWKTTYHTGRAMVNTTKRLHNMIIEDVQVAPY